ncbi:sensor histidine kinase [Vibrio spartinae]|uniref:histidine kinase n=1 Tax=Vibrio spartinae TaxID=1918945 RepID=A0A1N6LZT0_9VIBR|nr:HAMP domain-containing sensor histidine kinase [Vibrio spartinae]QMV16339.1 Sensor kinase CusS [Vibrio spartinae]SIO92670.1 Sensor kinase CusS [Vibrio spartinae]
MSKQVSLNRSLTVYFMLIALLTVGIYTELLIRFFDRGIDTAAKYAVVLNARKYAQEYERNPKLGDTSSFVTSFYLDNLDRSIDRYGDFFIHLKLKPNEYAVFEPPESTEKPDYYYVVYRMILHDGRSLYVVSNFNSKLTQPEDYADLLKSEYLMVYIAIGYLIIAMIALGLYSRHIGSLISTLSSWVQGLTIRNLDHPRPRLRYKEFEQIADSLENTLYQNQSLMEREKRFLSHASHELRTPIAIIRSNMEYLQRLSLPESTVMPLERLDRASMNMQLTTETLLWINRKNGSAPKIERVNLKSVITELMVDMSYLIQGEDVSVEFKCDGELEMDLPVVPLTIVLNNLLRNAYQYTTEGWILCHLDDHSVTIHNCDTSIQNGQESISFGFGFGLELTKQVCDKLEWTLDIKQESAGIVARLIWPE